MTFLFSKMATKALLYSADSLSFEKTKESRCKALVRQLLAIEISRRIYQRVTTRKAEIISTARSRSAPKQFIPEYLEPVIDKRLGVKFINPASAANLTKFRPLNWIERSQQFEV
jgi:hypothetical protein